MSNDVVTPNNPPVSAPATVSMPRGHDWVAILALIVALLAFLAGAGIFFFVQTRMQEAELQLARRIGEFDVSSRDARAAAKEARLAIDDLGARLAGLESKALDAQNQQIALAAMYQDLARGQDERILADIEQTLLLADQQLNLASNVRAAVLGLEAAEARLSRLRQPQFDLLRQAIGRDAARLRLLPAADLVSINARLDALLQSVDRLKPEFEPEATSKPPAAKSAGPVDWLGLLGRETWEEFKQLVRIRRLDHPDMALLTPQQTYFLRQNLKLRLLAARLAALQRDESTYRGDLAEARRWVEQYFNRQDDLTSAMVRDIKALEATPIAIKGASIAESLAALRGHLGRRD